MPDTVGGTESPFTPHPEKAKVVTVAHSTKSLLMAVFIDYSFVRGGGLPRRSFCGVALPALPDNPPCVYAVPTVVLPNAGTKKPGPNICDISATRLSR
jgi:hypothetical protein